MENHHHHPVLPPEIIHRIQSFLNGKEAAQTTLLSKSWRGAWSTRPNLDFNQRHFPGGCDDQEKFLDFANKSMQRYEHLRLRIKSFRLESYDNFIASKSLIVNALKLGAVDLDINFCTLAPLIFVLPDEVLRSQTLTRLSLTGSSYILFVDLVNLSCCNLKFLRLSHVVIYMLNDNINGDHLLMDLLSRNPLLERLELEDSFLARNLIILSSTSINPQFLKELVIRNCSGLQNIRISSNSLERISIKRRYCSSDNYTSNWETELCVPNIRKFKFEGNGWSPLVLKTTRRGWESDIRLKFRPTREWYIWLNNVLNDQLSLSRVSLSVSVDFPDYDCSRRVRAEGLRLHRLPVVEKLMLEGGIGREVISRVFLDNLFLICRPKMIVRRCRLFASNPKWVGSANKNLLKLIRKRVVVEEMDVEADHDHPPSSGLVRFHLRW